MGAGGLKKMSPVLAQHPGWKVVLLTETAHIGGGTEFWRKDDELSWTSWAWKKTEREGTVPS